MYWNVPRIVPFSVRGFSAVGSAESSPSITGPEGANFAKPKSKSFRSAGSQHDVAGFHVTVHNTMVVGVIERVRDLDPVAERLLERQAAFFQSLGQRFPSRCSITRKSIPPSEPTS